MRHLPRILFVTMLVTAGLVGPLAVPAAAATGAGIGAPGGSSAAPYDCTKLDVGIYWYDKDGGSRKAYADGRAIRGFYSPSRKTVIYAHGAQPDSMGPNNIIPTDPGRSWGRENFFWAPTPGMPIGSWVADAWFAADYNVGIFHWTQLADDDTTRERPLRSETKIWATEPSGTMRYRRCDGSLTTSGTTGRSVGQLYYDTYKQAMAKYTATSEVRLVGHSLGNQVTMAMAAKAYGDSSLAGRKRPKRIALVDPYWSPGAKDYLGGSTNAQRVNGIASTLKAKGVALEWTRTSLLSKWPAADQNDALVPLIGRTDVYPNWLGDLTGQIDRHSVAPKLYFWSMAFLPSAECDYDVSTGSCPGNGRPALSAATPLDRVKQMMALGKAWSQHGGTETPTPQDDTFYPPVWEPPILLGPSGRAPTAIPELLWRPGAGANQEIQVRVEGPDGSLVEQYTTSCFDNPAVTPCSSPFYGVPFRTLPAGSGYWTFRARTVGYGGSPSDWRSVSFQPLMNSGTPAFFVPVPDSTHDVTVDGRFVVTIPTSWRGDGIGLSVIFSPENDPTRTYAWEYFHGIPADHTTVPGLSVVNTKLGSNLALPFRNQWLTLTVKPYVIATGATDDRAVSVRYFQP